MNCKLSAWHMQHTQTKHSFTVYSRGISFWTINYSSCSCSCSPSNDQFTLNETKTYTHTQTKVSLEHCTFITQIHMSIEHVNLMHFIHFIENYRDQVQRTYLEFRWMHGSVCAVCAVQHFMCPWKDSILRLLLCEYLAPANHYFIGAMSTTGIGLYPASVFQLNAFWAAYRR